MIEPPCTERYARWCERTANQVMVGFLLDYFAFDSVWAELFRAARTAHPIPSREREGRFIVGTDDWRTVELCEVIEILLILEISINS